MQSGAVSEKAGQRAEVLLRLAEAIECKVRPFATDRERAVPVRTGWMGVDQALGGGLAAGALHEWIVDGLAVPPLRVLMHLARRAMNGLAVAWIGRACWPYPPALARGWGADRELLDRSIFVDAASIDERVWAIDLALRCPAVAAVVADASGLGLAATRRLQLAAADGGGIGLLARPSAERGAISAARTRWAVRATRSESEGPAWSVELLRCKGVRPVGEGARWIVQEDHETGDVCVAAHSGDGPGAASRPAAGQTA